MDVFRAVSSSWLDRPKTSEFDDSTAHFDDFPRSGPSKKHQKSMQKRVRIQHGFQPSSWSGFETILRSQNGPKWSQNGPTWIKSESKLGEKNCEKGCLLIKWFLGEVLDAILDDFGRHFGAGCSPIRPGGFMLEGVLPNSTRRIYVGGVSASS